MRRFQQIALMLTLLCTAAAANAASLFFVYAGNSDIDDTGQIVASVGDLIAFDIVMDFTDDPTIGGPFDVIFTTDSFSLRHGRLWILGIRRLVERQIISHSMVCSKAPTLAASIL